MEKKMEATIVYEGYVGVIKWIKDKKMEATIMGLYKV